MKLPSAEEYLQIIEKKPPASFAAFYRYQFLLRPDGKTCHYEKGRNAIVFKTQLNSNFYAIRFFLHDDPELFERYYQVQNFLNAKHLPWKVSFEFLDKEFYPALKSDWIDGLNFAQYLDSIIKDPALIGQLQSKLTDLSVSLEENGIGHGNLTPHHIWIFKKGQDYILKLIDYDSMFIPSFKGKNSLSVGTASFQHPLRLTSDFSETTDRFSFWIFLTALEAFKTEPFLWTNAMQNGYERPKKILFSFRDLAVPQQSETFQMLLSYDSEALKFYTHKLIEFCNAKSLASIEKPRLFGQKNIYSDRKNERAIINTGTDIDPLWQNKTEPFLTAYISASPALTTVEAKENQSLKKKDEIIRTELKSKPALRQQVGFAGKNKKGRAIAIISVSGVLVFTSVYFAAQNHSAKLPAEILKAQQKPAIPPTEKRLQQPTVFTSANITQFLFQLYQSYNKRDLSSILSNYADSLNQYYEAGSVTKDTLKNIIQNLFIKPAYYECKPDLRTLQFDANGNVCKLTIAITEIIKADKRSKTENYFSTIEYTVDKSFKILSEKNRE